MPAPANDNFASAQALSTTLPGTLTGLTTLDATLEGGEPLFGGGGDHQSIWFTFTPSASGWYKFRIPRSSMVYNGTHTSSWGELNMILYKGGTTVDTLAEATFANRFSINDATDVGFTDPGWLEPHDLVVLGELVAGTTYYIKIYSRTFGDFNKTTVDFDLEWDDVAPAANEDFANRETITGASGTESVYFGVPSHETPDEPESVYWYRGAMGDIATVWYEWTCPASGWYQFELEPDTVAPFSAWSGHIAIYTGSALNALTAVAKNEGGSKSENDKATGQTKVRVNLTNGVVYKIQIATRGASFISSGINGELRWATASAPTGDTGAAAIVGGFNTSLQDNLGNTDDDIPSDAVSRLSTAFGTEWWYEDGAVGRSKWFKQTITETGTLRIEAENFDTTYQAYMEHGLLVYKGATFGTIAAVTAQSGIDAVMFGWQGNNAFGGSTHAPNDDEFLDVPVTAGDVVWLCWVTSYDKDVLAESTQTAFPADAPQGELNIKFGTSGVPEVPPDNDVLADVPFTADFYFQRSRYGAFWIENDAGFRDGYTHLATADVGEPAHGGFPATRSVWYIFNRFSTELGTYKFWVDSAVDCTLAIYDLDLGNTIGTLIAEDDDSGPGNNPEITAIFTQAGLYCIAVDSKTEGFFRLNFQKVVAGTPPANDDFANAEVISSLPFSSSGTTVDANAEPEEIESQELGGGPKDTVWYKYVADHTGHLKIRATCDTNNVDAYVYVDSFQGTTLEELVRHPDPPPTGPGGGIFRGFFNHFDSPEENDAASIYLDIVNGETYYIRVQTEEGGSEDFTIYLEDAGIYVDLEVSGTEEFHGTMLDDAVVYLNLQHSGTELFDPALTTDAATVPLIITPGAAWETHGQETEDTGTVTIILTPLGGECYSRFHFTGEGEADLRWETISDLCRWSGDEQVRWTSVIEVQPGC